MDPVLVTGNVSSIDSRCFLREGLSRNAEHYVKAQNVVTSWFARQTGSAHIFRPVVYWFVSFSQGGGVSGCETLSWSRKCRYFLFCSPNRKCHHFPACNWLIRTVLTGAFSVWRTTLGSSKCGSGANQSITGRKMLALPVLVTPVFRQVPWACHPWDL